MRLVKAGESHGFAMVGILDGVPFGIKIDENLINSALAERNLAYGRSSRQAHTDKISILTGVADGVTIGNNVAFVIENNASSTVVVDENGVKDGLPPITRLRPGHADLSGLVKYHISDARMVAEGASARSTCLDVAAGAVALSMLAELGITVTAFVRAVGTVKDENDYSFNDVKNVCPPFFTANEQFAKKIADEVDRVYDFGDSVGGVLEVRVHNIKAGFGSYQNRINGAIARDLMSIQAIKGLYFGLNPFENGLYASQYSDRLQYDNQGKKALSSNSGGVDGGMTNGGDILLTLGVKPIPTTKNGLPSVDVNGEACISSRERADVTAVFALCPILKAKIAITICNYIIDSLGGENMQDIIDRYEKRV